ncbi:MAG: hypothetical protein HY699_20465 [Deltaproteobacteria bacterium]|nr:hypothetical protein [Deltaproteobacteria bacterium]
MVASRSISTTVLVALLAVGPAWGMRNDQPGFDKLKLRQPLSEVQKTYPKMRKMNDSENLGAATILSPLLQRYHQLGVKLSGLSKPVSLELRFWKEQLWVVVVYFGENSRDDVVRMLKKRYGEPTFTQPDPAWNGKQVGVGYAPKEGWFSVGSIPIASEIQNMMAAEMQRLRERQQQRSQPAAPAPVAP